MCSLFQCWDHSNDEVIQMISDSYSTTPALVLDLLQTYRSSYACCEIQRYSELRMLNSWPRLVRSKSSSKETHYLSQGPKSLKAHIASLALWEVNDLATTAPSPLAFFHVPCKVPHPMPPSTYRLPSGTRSCKWQKAIYSCPCRDKTPYLISLAKEFNLTKHRKWIHYALYLPRDG